MQNFCIAVSKLFFRGKPYSPCPTVRNYDFFRYPGCRKSVLLLLLLTVSVHAQEDDKPLPWIVKLNVPQLIDMTNFPVVQLSLERKINSEWSVIAEGGVQCYDDRIKPDTVFYSPRGFKVNVELRAYLLKIINPERFHKEGGLFVGIQPFYRYNQFSEEVSYFKEEADTAPKDSLTERIEYNDSFGARRKVFGVNLTVGHQRYFWKRFVMEPSLAVGYAYRKVTNINRSYDPIKDNSTFNHDLSQMEYRATSESNGSTFNFTINFRIGYSF
ncbi:Protein of unknown function [Flavobacterium caeni]|uniref:Uncharacterized protein n=1 Tax=Flavobacterium caeni TaxID=490189 RepID=A0A1G5JNT1_9FLAO|nr:Protein of unknown function [Flavobacterium caeni]